MTRVIKPSVQTIHADLHRMIADLELMPGARVTEMQLADHFKVSRTPVRAALQLLESEGLLTIKPKQGCFIRNIDLQQISDYYNVRVYLENMTLEEIGRRNSADEVAALGEQWDPDNGFFGKDITAELKQAEEQFHLQLAAITRNAALANYLADINDKVRVVRRLGWPDRESVDDTYAEHHRICELLLAGDVATAKQEMTHHIRKSQERASRITLDQLYGNRKASLFDA